MAVNGNVCFGVCQCLQTGLFQTMEYGMLGYSIFNLSDKPMVGIKPAKKIWGIVIWRFGNNPRTCGGEVVLSTLTFPRPRRSPPSTSLQTACGT